MKRIGNKGFTVSTLLYGLLLIALLLVLLIMNSMSNNRANTRQLVKKIEGDLNRFSNSNSELRPTTSGEDSTQEFLVPPEKAGWYKIELWAPRNNSGTKGDYVSGLIYLYSNDSIYFKVNKTTDTPADVQVFINPAQEANSTLMVANQGNSTIMGYNSNAVSYANVEDDPHDSEATRTRVYSIFNGFISKNVYNEDIGRATINLVSKDPVTAPPGKKSALLMESNHPNIKYVKISNPQKKGKLVIMLHKENGLDTTSTKPESAKNPKIEVRKMELNISATTGEFTTTEIGAEWTINDIIFFPEAAINITNNNFKIQFSTTSSGTYTNLIAGKRSIDTNGLHITAWDQYGIDGNLSENFEAGSYYIIAATNKAAMNDHVADGVRMDPMSAAVSEKWYIQRQSSSEQNVYKIMNPSNNRVLSLSGGIDFADSNYWNEINGDTEIPVQTTQNQAEYQAQLWRIERNSNGTYSIKMNLEELENGEVKNSYSGFLFRARPSLDGEGDSLYTKKAFTSPLQQEFADFILRKTEY